MRKYTPWWGYVTYGALWAFLACTIVAVLVAIVFELVRPSWSDDPLDLAHWAVHWMIALMLVAPPFVLWSMRHHRDVLTAAREGSISRGNVVAKRRAWALAFFLRLGRRARSTRMRVAVGSDIYRVIVRGEQPWWSEIGSEIDIVAAPHTKHGFAIARDGEDFAAKRV